MKAFKAFGVFLPSGLTVHRSASLQATDFVTKSYLSRNSIIACKVYLKKKKKMNPAMLFHSLNSDKCKRSREYNDLTPRKCAFQRLYL